MGWPIRGGRLPLGAAREVAEAAGAGVAVSIGRRPVIDGGLDPTGRPSSG
jgi:hypothetical protein